MSKKNPSCKGRPVTHYISKERLMDIPVEQWARNSMGCDFCPLYAESEEKTPFKCDPGVTVETERGGSRIKATVTPK